MEPCFLEKGDLQHQGKSILISLFGIPSMWGSQNDMVQPKYFRSEFVFSATVETKVMKKKLQPQNWKKIFIMYILLYLSFSKDLLTDFFRKIENYLSYFFKKDAVN